MDELLGNEMCFSEGREEGSVNVESESQDDVDNTELNKKIRVGLAIILGAIAGVWAYSANRFRYDEIFMFVGVGAVVGYCLGMVCHSVLKYIKNK